MAKHEKLTGWRERVIGIGEGIADFVSKNEIGNVVLLDREARQAYIPMKYALRALHPQTPMPEVFFVNPEGCTLPSGFFSRLHCSPRKKFMKAQPQLYKQRDRPTLIFDVCLHTGKTARPVMDLLDKVGFERTHFLVASSVYSCSPLIVPDATCFSRNVGCYPLAMFVGGFTGGEYSIEKGQDSGHKPSLVSRPGSNPKSVKSSLDNRRAMHIFLREHYGTS